MKVMEKLRQKMVVRYPPALFPLHQPFVAAAGKPVADLLQYLHDENKQHAGGEHDVRLIAVIAVHDGQLAQSAPAHRAGHGGIAEYGGAGYGAAVNQGGQCFGDENPEDDLEGGCSHGLRRFHNARIR